MNTHIPELLLVGPLDHSVVSASYASVGVEVLEYNREHCRVSDLLIYIYIYIYIDTYI